MTDTHEGYDQASALTTHRGPLENCPAPECQDRHAEQQAGAEPVCKFEEGCHRVAPCDPGCATGHAALRDRIAETLRPHASLGGTPPRYEVPYFDGATPGLPRISGWKLLDFVADAVLAVLPEPADRAAVLREAAAFIEAEQAREEATEWAQYGELDHDTELQGGAVRHSAHLLRRLAGATAAITPEANVDLTDGPIHCPLCPTPVTLHTPNGARAHFTNVHPEQRLVGPGPWPLLATDGNEARQEGAQAQPTGYGDGKGRVFCLKCAPTVGADVPLTANDVDHWELCPSCGRHVVDVARNTEEPQS